jgi:hypothetical protein
MVDPGAVAVRYRSMFRVAVVTAFIELINVGYGTYVSIAW